MLSRFRLVEIVVMMIITLAFSFGALAQDEVLTIGTTSQVTELSPANSYDSWTWHTLRQVTETLVTIVPGTGEILPLLAESWEVSDDATVYTFHLRQGVIFWDGAPFDAKAMKWVLERNLALNGPEGAVPLIQIIDDIAVVDDYTLRIEIGEPNATFLALLADPIAPAMALSPECTPLDEFANGCFAGTGPYRLVEHIPGQQTVYESFPEYWGDPPKIARVVERFFDDSSSLLAALETGQIDIAYDHTLTWNDISELRGNPNLQVLFPRAAGNRIRYLVCNVTAPPFDNVHVRRALAYAVDRDQLNASVFFGLNTPVYSMVPPDVWGHIDSFPKRDLERALQELHQAGYSSSNPLEITIYGSTHYGSEEGVVAEALKIALEQTGAIEVNTSVLDDWGDYVQKMVSGDLDFFLLGWNPDFFDPDNLLSPWLVDSPDVLGTNLNSSISAYDKSVYERFLDLLTEARQMSDRDGRVALYAEAQELLADSAVLIPLYLDHRETCVITRSGIDGLVFGLNATLQNWSIKKELEVEPVTRETIERVEGILKAADIDNLKAIVGTFNELSRQLTAFAERRDLTRTIPELEQTLENIDLLEEQLESFKPPTDLLEDVSDLESKLKEIKGLEEQLTPETLIEVEEALEEIGEFKELLTTIGELVKQKETVGKLRRDVLEAIDEIEEGPEQIDMVEEELPVPEDRDCCCDCLYPTSECHQYYVSPLGMLANPDSGLAVTYAPEGYVELSAEEEGTYECYLPISLPAVPCDTVPSLMEVSISYMMDSSEDCIEFAELRCLHDDGTSYSLAELTEEDWTSTEWTKRKLTCQVPINPGPIYLTFGAYFGPQRVTGEAAKPIRKIRIGPLTLTLYKPLSPTMAGGGPFCATLYTDHWVYGWRDQMHDITVRLQNNCGNAITVRSVEVVDETGEVVAKLTHWEERTTVLAGSSASVAHWSTGVPDDEGGRYYIVAVTDAGLYRSSRIWLQGR